MATGKVTAFDPGGSVMAFFCKGMTTRDAFIGGFLGLIGALAGVIFSPAVREATLGHPKGSALFQISNPALFSMAIAGVWLAIVLIGGLALRRARGDH